MAKPQGLAGPPLNDPEDPASAAIRQLRVWCIKEAAMTRGVSLADLGACTAAGQPMGAGSGPASGSAPTLADIACLLGGTRDGDQARVGWREEGVAMKLHEVARPEPVDFR